MMRIKGSAMAWLMALALLAMVSMGCVPSLQPLIDDRTATFEPALVGTWVMTDDGRWRRLAPGETSTEDRWVVARHGDANEYDVKVLGVDDGEGDREPSRYHARTATFSTGKYFELRPEDDANVTREILAMHFIAASTFYRIEIQGDTLEHFVLNEDWLERGLESRTLRLPHAEVGGNLVITASTKQLQRFIARHGRQPDAFVPFKDVE